ncbi:hypothetical protein NGB36_00060 [Streptomyces sp. RB6PN25]|uniref:Uncharacterized protein n=1 Tax=Streptomyces humicola TaxID=2953240 RepID=A0ABT1PN02_9ACTN|nr:hypothetical protein [Streptomyces humicola]MCQ4079056.1 hypothetical protein [Streptomyces humicola]
MAGYRCEHVVILPQGGEHRIVLAAYQAVDPEAALRWVLERASSVSVHLSAAAAEAIETLLADENERTAFVEALQSGYGYGFELSDIDTGTQLDGPTVHLFTTRRSRLRPTNRTE